MTPSPQPGASSGGGWGAFASQAWQNLQPRGMFDRFQQTRDVRRQVDEGAPATAIPIDPENHRLRNFADMRQISRDHQGRDQRPAADSIGDANGLFYTLFGNNGGDFSGMDRDALRRVGSLPVPEAREQLPVLEAEAFGRSADARTRAFGNSLPAQQRGELFSAWGSGRAALPPRFPHPRPPGGGDGDG